MFARAIIIVTTIALVVFGGGTAGWYALANWVDGKATNLFKELEATGRILDCQNMQVKGFPFRVGVFCDTVHYENQNTQTKMDAGALRSAAQFYQPGFAIVELDSPATISFSNQSQWYLEWKLAHSSVKLKTESFERISIEIKDLDWKWRNSNGAEIPFGIMENLSFHVRPKSGELQADDIELALAMLNYDLPEQSYIDFPKFTFSVDGEVRSVKKRILSGMSLQDIVSKFGMDMTVHKAELALENGAELTATGPLSFDRNGFLNGKILLETNNLDEVEKRLVTLFPALEDTISALRSALIIFGGTSEAGNPIANLEIRNGDMWLGLIPLGKIGSVL